MPAPHPRIAVAVAVAALGALPAAAPAAPAVNASPANGAVIPGMKIFPLTWTLPAPATPGAAQNPIATVTRDGKPSDLGTFGGDYFGDGANTLGLRPRRWQPAGRYSWFTTLAGEKGAATTFTIKPDHRVVAFTARENGSWVFRTLKVKSNVQDFKVAITVRANGRVVARDSATPNKGFAWSNDAFDLSENMVCTGCRRGAAIAVDVRITGGGLTVTRTARLTWR